MNDQQTKKDISQIIKELQEAFQVQEQVEEQIKKEQGPCRWLFQRVFHNQQAKELLAKRTLDLLDQNKTTCTN